MIRLVTVGVALLSLAGSAWGATSDTTTTTGGGSTPIAKLLQQGYDIKAAFYDNSGGAYMVLQKTPSAYLCHSNPNQVCEKLN